MASRVGHDEHPTVEARVTQVDPAGPVSRRERTRERLMDAAFDTFAEEGFAAASVEAISERAGFSRGAFYYHFASKEELFLALVERSIHRRLGAAEEGPTIDGFFVGLDDDDRLLDVMRGQGVEDDLKWVMVVTEYRLHTVRGDDAAGSVRFDALYRTVIDGLAARLSEFAASAGVTFTVPADLVASLIIGVYMQTVIDGAVARLDRADSERITAAHLLAVIRGLVRQG